MLYWLASYPRSGNTWCRILLTPLLQPEATRGESFSRPSGVPMADHRHFVDECLDCATADLTDSENALLRRQVLQFVAQEAGRPLPVKTHAPFGILKDGQPWVPINASAGVVLIVRNPLDVAVSLAFFLGLDMDAAIDWMADPASGFGPQGGPTFHETVGCWSHHAQSWLHQQALPVHVVRYEDLHTAPQSTLERLCRFMKLSVTADDIARSIDAAQFKRLQTQEAQEGFFLRQRADSAFFRDGRVGQWRTALTHTQRTRLLCQHRVMMQRLDYNDADLS